MMSDVSDRLAAMKTIEQSEKSYRQLFNSVGEAIHIQHIDGTFVDVNETACLMYGYEKEELIGQKPEFIAAPGKNNLGNLDLLKSEALLGRPQSFRWWGKKKTGEVFPAEVRLTKGTYFGDTVVIATARDITEEMEAQQTLQESELRFRTLQEASFGGIGLHNKGYIVDCNQGLCDITGFTYDELIGSNGLDLIAPEYRELVMQKILAKEVNPYDVEGVRKNGTRYHLEIHGKNIPYREGLIRVTEFRDITDRKAAEAKIVEQNARLVVITENLKQKNEQLQEFTQIVSHNLRSPVGNILSLLNFIENAETEEERTEYIGLLKEAGASTLNTLQELNEVLQIKQNKNIERQRLEFELVFNNIRRMLSAKIAESNAEIICSFDGAPTIEYPHIYLESIMLNLVSNALKYASPGRKPVIRITTFSSDASISLVVADNGSGINMQRYGHQIFKLRKTFHKHPESRGIGLFMIKNQIEAMGGSIAAESIENEGSSFRIDFNR